MTLCVLLSILPLSYTARLSVLWESLLGWVSVWNMPKSFEVKIQNVDGDEGILIPD
jgi:hypothetical protein